MEYVKVLTIAVLLCACSATQMRADEPQATLPPTSEKLYLDACGWYPRPPAAERIPVDVALVRLGSGSGSLVPTDDEIETFAEAGGRVLHVFNVNLLRLEIDRLRLQELVAESDAIIESASTVTDFGSYDVELTISYSGPIQPSDIDALNELGVEVRGEPFNSVTLFVVASDQTVPRIVALPNVRVVRALSIQCMSPDGS